MSGSEGDAAKPSPQWDTLGAGADLWATVVMASGFVLPADQEVREHYHIVRPLGQGGMGQVLGVKLAGSADEQVFALKMVARPTRSGDGAAADPADRRDAEIQARAFAALLRGEAAKQELVQRHGVSVARLFALVRFEDGALGLRMEIARGHSLETFIESEARTRAGEAPDLDYCLVVGRKLLYQLRRLHELVDPSSPSGFVHSDVKPGNVFVDDGDRYDPYITLLDFGVATAGHALDGDSDGGGRASARKSLILQSAGGTFGYAPPHHFTGKPTPLSDVYAALVILYEMIALRSPWDFGDLAKTPANLFKLDDVMRAGPRSVRSSRPGIPADTATVLDRFFADEFRALQSLADSAHEARRSPDESVRKSAVDRVRGLAQVYQGKLDALRAEATGARVSGEPPVRVSVADAPIIAPALTPTPAPTPAVTPAPTPTPMPAPVSTARPVPTPTVPGRPAQRRPARSREDPPRVPMEPLVGWKTLTLIFVLGAGGLWMYFQGIPPPIEDAARTVLGWPASDAGASEDAAAVTVVPPDARALRDAAVEAATSRDARTRTLDAAVDVARARMPDVGTDTPRVIDAGAAVELDVHAVSVVREASVSPDVFQAISLDVASVDAARARDVPSVPEASVPRDATATRSDAALAPMTASPLDAGTSRDASRPETEPVRLAPAVRAEPAPAPAVRRAPAPAPAVRRAPAPVRRAPARAPVRRAPTPVRRAPARRR